MVLQYTLLDSFWLFKEKWLRNDQEMTGFEWEILFMTINDWYHPFSSANHKQSLNEIV